MKMYFQLAWQNIWRNKRRTLITVSSIFFAVLLAQFMRSVQLGSYNHMIRNSVQFYTGYIQLHAAGFWDDKSLENTFVLDDGIIDKAYVNEHVQLVTPRLESFALASSENLTKGVMVVGIDPEKENGLTNLKDKLVEGDYLQKQDGGALVAKGLAEYLNIGVGDTLVMIGQGFRGMSAAGLYPVSGLVEFPTPDLNRQMVYLTLAEAQYFYAADNRATALSFLIDKQKHMDVVVNDLKAAFDDTYEVMSWREMMTELVEAIEVDNAFGWVMLAILYIIIGFGIFGTVMMMTAERRQEFGVLIAVGMKRRQLISMVALETLFITVVGSFFGFLLGIPFIMYMSHHPIPLTGKAAEAMLQFGLEPIMPFSVEPVIFINQTLIVFVLALLTLSYPLISLLRLKVVEAMRA